MNRAPTAPGRIAFVGSGPGDPGLLTLRAREALGAAPVVVTDPDVPEGVLALVADGAEVRPAVGEPVEVAEGLNDGVLHEVIGSVEVSGERKREGPKARERLEQALAKGRVKGCHDRRLPVHGANGCRR